MNQSIFSYAITETELNSLEIPFTDVNLYLKNTSTYNRLYDLYKLFMIRKDEQAVDILWKDSIMDKFIVKPIVFFY